VRGRCATGFDDAELAAERTRASAAGRLDVVAMIDREIARRCRPEGAKARQDRLF
jgi:hypothetical protein